MATGLEHEFELAMRDIYRRAERECGYRPTYFQNMISERGGLSTAQALLVGKPSDGFTKLYMLGRLDLSVEVVALDPKWRSLFTDAELAEARRRLKGTEFAHL